MQLVRSNGLDVDEWLFARATAPLPQGGDVVVSTARWAGERETLLQRGGRLGITLGPDDDLDAIVDDLQHFALVALNFESFVDGRHYSNARLLRVRYGFDGELRATGQVLRDQLFYLARCGFDAYVVPDTCDIDDYLRGLNDFSQVYQSAHDDRTPVYRLRANG